MKIPMDERSKVVFGSEYRLGLLCAIATAPESDLYATRLAELSHTPAGQVSKDLNRLDKIGLLKKARPDKGSRLIRYARVDSVLWSIVLQLGQEWGDPRRK